MSDTHKGCMALTLNGDKCAQVMRLDKAHQVGGTGACWRWLWPPIYLCGQHYSKQLDTPLEVSDGRVVYNVTDVSPGYIMDKYDISEPQWKGWQLTLASLAGRLPEEAESLALRHLLGAISSGQVERVDTVTERVEYLEHQRKMGVVRRASPHDFKPLLRAKERARVPYPAKKWWAGATWPVDYKGEPYEPCLLCDRPTLPSRSLHLEMSTDHEMLPDCEEGAEDSQGCFPVCRPCRTAQGAKRRIGGYLK